jgi:hypothetical protein
MKPIISTAILLSSLLTTSCATETQETKRAFKTKFYNAVSKEVDLLSVTTKNGHEHYEGISYHVVPKSTIDVEVYEGELVYAMVTDTDEIVSKFRVKGDEERFVVQWGTGDEL